MDWYCNLILFTFLSCSWYHVDTVSTTHGLLYPRESETRDVRSLDGIWNFVKSEADNPMQGVRDAWFKTDLDKIRATIPMPVPASYNDITTDQALRDHVGTVWYDRKFFVPRSWSQDQKVWLRFGSVHYAAILWLNGAQVAAHSIGHLPFEAQITSYVKYGAENRLTVMCDNTLLNTTVPQGKVVQIDSDDGIVLQQTYTFDFFNYAGIHRPVHLYTTPKVYIEDVDVSTFFGADNTGFVTYAVSTQGAMSASKLFVYLQLRDKSGEIVAHTAAKKQLNGIMKVPNAQPWYPYLMHSNPAYLYTLEIFLHCSVGGLLDVYRLKIGIRSLHWNATTLLLNNNPIYLRGFGRHEDSDFRGKGLDYALLTRDFNLLKWIGANTYRTSHYPYSEESMQFADEHGIMIIDECPSVNTDIFDPVLLENHKSALEQLIHRDRNHVSVIMWSIANEPRSTNKNADAYFSELSTFTKSLDPTRPITAAINAPIEKDKLAQYLDIISFNHYNGWYENTGSLNMITKNVIQGIRPWNTKYNKPVIMMEYGADTVEGLHFLPSYVWSEDFQSELLGKHFQAFDTLREETWFVGEFVWNFADFKTAQTVMRVGGNKKGIFSRNRQPKSAAYLLRQRYYSLAEEIDGCEAPKDLFKYVINWRDISPQHTEL